MANQYTKLKDDRKKYIKKFLLTLSYMFTVAMGFFSVVLLSPIVLFATNPLFVLGASLGTLCSFVVCLDYFGSILVEVSKK